jgi:hypothetical protein
MIFGDAPEDWQELEDRVQQVLAECGCQAERGKSVALPRGSVDVDVYALDTTRQPNLIVVCECKQWGTPVPKTVVHAFRTIMDEIGAHVGFIISAKGFQAGALEAARNTNIELLSWEEFQTRFFDRWFDAMRVKLAAVADKVFDYADYFHPRTTSVLHAIPARVEELMMLHQRCSAYVTATSYHQVFRPNRASFPLDIIDPRSAVIRTITMLDARTYFDLLLSAAQQAIAPGFDLEDDVEDVQRFLLALAERLHQGCFLDGCLVGSVLEREPEGEHGLLA